MKRILCFVLSLLMICTLISCSKEEETEKKENEGTDLSQLNGELLYRHGEEKMEALKSALYTTKLYEDGEELGTFETVRIRKGYDGFIYSRTGQGFYVFDGEYAYAKNKAGSYTAPCTIRVFEEYLKEFVFSVCALDPDLLENFQRDGDTVTYESSKEELLSLYHLEEKPDFVPLSLTGSARLDEEGVILEENLTLKGENGEYELKTVLTDDRSESIKIAEIESIEGYTKLADIRLPLRLEDAILSLYKQKEVQTTIVASKTMTLGEAKYVLSEDVNTYAKEDDGAYYISRQNLKQIPDLPEESVFYQARLTDGKKTESRYNVILGEKTWENAEDAVSLAWEDEVRRGVPAISDFATLAMTEEVGGYTISFTLTEEAAKSIAQEIALAFPESGVTLQAVTVRSLEGTLSIDTTRGILTALSYTVEGGFASAAGAGEYMGRFSVLVDRTKDVTLPELQTPT
ncbi:MAG: hypothetical protein IJC26_00070, partial [Clostridia bacterium]|nr:hypothetical protein [Clostridia bacterium]